MLPWLAVNRTDDCAWFGAGGESISPSLASDKTVIRFDGVVKVGTDCCSRKHTIGERDATGECRHVVSERLPCQAFCITKHSLHIAVIVHFAGETKSGTIWVVVKHRKQPQRWIQFSLTLMLSKNSVVSVKLKDVCAADTRRVYPWILQGQKKKSFHEGVIKIFTQ